MSGRNRALGDVRRLLIFLAVAALLAAARPTPRSLLPGACVAAMGEALRLWASGHLVKTTRLVTSGPYAWTRNPLYLGRLLLWTGLTLAATLPHHLTVAVLAGGYALFFIYYLPRKERVEGRRLGERHGARYEAYRRSVPLLFPSTRRDPTASSDPWSARLMLRSGEPNVVLGLILAFALLAWKTAHP